MGWFRSKKHPAHRLTIEPPQPSPGRHGIAIVACVKNEEPYIEEWVRFHLAVGVRHFVIYDDGSTDGTKEKLQSILDDKALTVIPWRTRMIDAGVRLPLNGQVIAFAHGILNFGSMFNWMAFIDVDEFLLPMYGSTIAEALAGSNGAPNISLPWHMFGTSGHRSKPAGPMLLNYIARHADPMTPEKHVSNFKCVVDPCEVTEVSVHHFNTKALGELTANDSGKLFTRSARKAAGFYSNRFLQLNHYYTKSRAEFDAKVGRGWSYDAGRAKYVKKAELISGVIESDVVNDRSMIEFIRKHQINLGE